MVDNTKMCSCFCSDICYMNLEEILLVTFEERTGNKNMFLCFGELKRREGAVL